jgi:hypothetical protein
LGRGVADVRDRLGYCLRYRGLYLCLVPYDLE